MKKKLRPPIKTHGGKYYLCNWIIDNFPENYQNMVYLEPYCGGANVLLNKEQSKEECINDIHLGIIQIFRALRDEPGEFIQRIKKLKYCQKTFDRLKNKEENNYEDYNYTDYIDHAVNEFALRRMSRGGLKNHLAWSTRKRGNQPGDLNAWQTIIEMLPCIAKRIESVYITNKPAIEIIKAFNNKDVLLYLDPPYLPESRTSINVYEHEMNTDDHIQLSEVLENFHGKVVLSGYPSKLYNRLYNNWNCKKKNIANHASQKKVKDQKTEMLWMNF
jgi:DNA adenine methylase